MSAPPRPTRHRLREDAPPPHARPRALGQGAGADGRGTVGPLRKDALYGCYLRVGDPGPWAGPWAGIARLEMPSGIGRAAAVEVAERAAGWLPGFASALHRDARAPVNLTPIAGLERHLHRLQVREAVLERNCEGRTA